MRVFGPEEVARCLGNSRCVEAMRQAFVMGSTGAIRQPARSIVDLGEGAGMAWMPGSIVGSPVCGAKLMARFPTREGAHAKAGAFLLFDRERHELVAVVDAPTLTNARTAAATVVASDVLARAGDQVVAILGTGALARAHVHAFQDWPRTSEIVMWGRTVARAQAVVEDTQARSPIPMRAVSRIEDAMAAAAIVCTVTAATEPFVRGEWLRPGQHLNAVGASTPHEREVDLNAVARARVFVDSRASAATAAGELREAAQVGLGRPIEELAEVGDVLLGRLPGRTNGDEITLFKSLGLFSLDCLAVQLLLEPDDRAQGAHGRSSAGDP